MVLSTWKLTVGYVILLSLPNTSVLPEWVGGCEAWWKSAANFLMHILFWSYMNANNKNLCNSSKACRTWFLDQFLFCLHMPREQQQSHLICVSMENSGQFIKPCWPSSPIKWSTYEGEREREERGDGLCTWLALLDLLEPTIVLSSCSRQPIVRGQQDLPNQI